MKRFALLAMIAAFILGSISIASATELKAKGALEMHADWSDNIDFQESEENGDASEDDFQVQQRMRVFFSFIANENLKAVLGIEIGTQLWGVGGSVGRSTGAGLDTDGVNIETKNAYLDFNVPGSTVNVKAGLQPIAFPYAFGSSAILDADAAALVVATPFNEMVGMTLGWARVADGTTDEDPIGGVNTHDESDVFLLALPITPKGMSITPWGAYMTVGADAALGSATTGALNAVAADETSSDVYWLGLAFELSMFDPFVFAADINYGKQDNEDNDRSGWLFDLRVDYKGWAFAKPALFFMYSTGEDDDADNSERMPYIIEDWNIPGGFWHGGSAFDAQNGHGSDKATVAEGQWTVGAGLYGMSFLPKLTHDLIVIYAQGTNDEESVAALQAAGFDIGTALTEKDHIWEIDFNHQYQIYEQLQAILELGMIFPKYDKNIGWAGTYTAATNTQTNTAFTVDNAWRVLFGLKYKY